jgi:hypothetical protein
MVGDVVVVAAPDLVEMTQGGGENGASRYGHLFPELDMQIATGLDLTYQRSLRVIRGEAEDTTRTRKSHEIGANGGPSRIAPDNPNTHPDQHFSLEAATGIEPVYRALQASWNGHRRTSAARKRRSERVRVRPRTVAYVPGCGMDMGWRRLDDIEDGRSLLGKTAAPSRRSGSS